MPRFGTKSLFVLVAVVALWLSTFGGYGAADDVRRSILLLIFVTAGVAAAYTRGRDRAFCAAFFAVMLLCGGISLSTPMYRYVPTFHWQEAVGLSNNLTPLPSASPVLPQGRPYTTYQISPSPYYATPAAPVYVSPSAPMSRSATWEAVADSLAAVWTLGLAAAAGFVAALVYSQAREVK
jgi:hypothetical protein